MTPLRRPQRQRGPSVHAVLAAVILALLFLVPSVGLLAAEPVGSPSAEPVALTSAEPSVSFEPVAAIEPAAASLRMEGRYRVHLDLGWQNRRVALRTRIALLNTSGGPVKSIKLNTVAARHGRLSGLRVKVDGVNVKARVSGQTITVPFPDALADGASSVVVVAFKARLTTSLSGRAWFFAKLGNVAQLYRFIPWLSRAVPFGSGGHGEPFVTPVSPRVEVTVSSDRKLVWATSGRRIRKEGPRSATYLAEDVRDFNIAASPAWRSSRGRSKDDATGIIAYTFGGNGRRLVNLARQELARYKSITGVAFPHPTYVIAETGGGLPMESPALIWIPRHRPASDLPYLVSHETAHQWFYSTVGNDQAKSAFADEAMADYFSRKAHLSIRASRCATDRLDREIRSYSGLCYFEVIYIQGSRFLDQLRKDFGNTRFRAAVRAYTRDNRFEIASNKRLLEALRAEFGDQVLKRYRARFPSLY